MSILPNATFISPGNAFFGSSGVTSIVAGTGMTIDPPSGLGDVTVNALPFFPGMIMMYNALPPTVLPLNWFLCDGGTYNGFITPDLRDKFVICTGPANPTIGLTGGAASTALTLDMLPDHTHGLQGQINATNAAPGTNTNLSICSPGGVSTSPSAPWVGGTAVPTLPPYISMAYICYCGTG